jgi:hypothetical protein
MIKMLFVLTFILSFAMTTVSVALPPMGPQTQMTVANPMTGDHFVPWPWGLEMPFPWSFVQGVWMAEYGNFKSYFSFRVVRESNGLNQLVAEQIDPRTCTVIARGVGFESGRTVRAQMTGAAGSVYRVSLRAFSEKSVPVEVGQQPIYGQYVVLSMMPFDTDAKNTMHIPIQQVTNQLGFQCRVNQ